MYVYDKRVENFYVRNKGTTSLRVEAPTVCISSIELIVNNFVLVLLAPRLR